MAAEEKTNINNEELGSPEGQEEKKEGGNFFSRFGKIFLIIAVLLGQTGVSYAVINNFYADIYSWMESFSPKGNVYHKFENIIINPANSDGERYLILSMAVELNSGSDIALIENKSAKIIDQLNLILTKRTANELSDLEIRDEIKQEIGIMINETIGKKAVRNLFIIKYVLQ